MTNEERYEKYIDENCKYCKNRCNNEDLCEIRNVCIMKEKINYENCMKYKCEQCKYNVQCEKEEKRYEIQNKWEHR